MHRHPTDRRTQRAGVLALLAAAALLGTAGCSSTPRANRPAVVVDGDQTVSRETRLRRAAREWEGTPHRLGGLDRRGIDCSGLVVRIYGDLFGHRLPRTTGALAQMGQSTAGYPLAPGDLVFFRIPPRKQHVGIYLGQEQFVHASTSRGVIISRLDDPYWRRVFWTSRRLL